MSPNLAREDASKHSEEDENPATKKSQLTLGFFEISSGLKAFRYQARFTLASLILSLLPSSLQLS